MGTSQNSSRRAARRSHSHLGTPAKMLAIALLFLRFLPPNLKRDHRTALGPEFCEAGIMSVVALFPIIAESDIAWSLTRAELRDALDDTGVSSTALVPHARSVTVFVDNNGVIQQTKETTIRDPKTLAATGTADTWLSESPAPLSATSTQSLTHVIAAAVPGLMRAAEQADVEPVGWRLDMLVSPHSIDVATATAFNRMLHFADSGAWVSVDIRATDEATVQGWRQFSDATGTVLGLLDETNETVNDDGIRLLGRLPDGSQVRPGDALANVQVLAPTREGALDLAAQALASLRCDGPADNRGASIALVQHPSVIQADIFPVLSHILAQPETSATITPHLLVEQAGIQTTVQDRGRSGVWRLVYRHLDRWMVLVWT